MASEVGGNKGDGNSSRSQNVELKYRMNYPKRGRFIIFNNRTFKVRGKKFAERSGTNVDSKNLENIFGKILQFDVEVHDDLTSGQMEEVMQSEAANDHSNCDCFGVAILTYEDKEGVLYGFDCAISIDRLLEPIKKCESLYGKPKLCFIQACKPVTGKKFQIESDDVKPLQPETIRLPLEADFLYAYSTVPGVYSWKECNRGSWFIEALTDKLTRLAYEDIDLVRILTRVINQVAQELTSSKKTDEKVPSITSMLTKDVYFSKKLASSS